MKQNQTQQLRRELAGVLIGLVKVCGMHGKTAEADQIIAEGLSAGVRGVDEAGLNALIRRAADEKLAVAPGCANCAMPCGNTENYDLRKLEEEPERLRQLKILLLLAVQTLAACAWQAFQAGQPQEELNRFFYKALSMVTYELEEGDLLQVLAEAGALGAVCHGSGCI